MDNKNNIRNNIIKYSISWNDISNYLFRAHNIWKGLLSIDT